jgi:membrane-bound serine protease (ClpP class)
MRAGGGGKPVAPRWPSDTLSRREANMKLWASILVAGATFATSANVPAGNVGLIEINGAIGPATANYIARAIQVATAADNACLVIQLDTPGGLVDSTKDIVQSFYDSKIPIVVYVAPPPATATSAGSLITMAADVATMAPHTTIGAAHPVSIGVSGEVEKVDDVMKKKQENALASFAESIANKRHRNAEWARSAVIESVSITAEKALELNVIDLIATNLPGLLNQIDGGRVGEATLHTAGAQIVRIPMTAGEKFLQLFLRPEALFVLMLIVIFGIMGELSNPGAILPGVAGAIALVLVLYLSAMLPVNLAGVALILLAVALFIIDIFAPSHGVLTFGGIVSFCLGALMLFSGAGPAFRLSLAYIIPAALLTAAFFIFIVGAGLRAQRLPVRAGHETMLGRVVPARERIDANGGTVFVEGELWRAVSDAPVEPGQPVEIVGVDGLTLKVKPKAA